MAESRKIPEVGDEYTPLFQSDLGDLLKQDWELLKIAEVEHETDTPGTWCITASDGIGYDCCWSEEFQIWCYNLG